MTDIPHRRRTTGRLLFGAAVLAVPLTASVSYAQADASAVEAIELDPSTVAPPAPPAPPAAPEAPVPPEAPEPPEVWTEHRTLVLRDGEPADRERRVYQFRGQPLSEEQLKELKELGKRFEGEDWEAFARSQEEMAERFAREFAERGEEMAERMARLAAETPLVEERCDGSGVTTRSFTDESGRKRIVICQRAIERQANSGAVAGLRQARDAVARNGAIEAETRDEILKDLDSEIRRLERENRGS